MTYALQAPTTPPPARADLTYYAARRVGAALHGAGYDYAPDNALTDLIARVASVLAQYPGDAIACIEPNGHDDAEGQLMLIVETRSGHLLACELPCVRRVVRRRHEHARLLAFAHSMSDAVKAADHRATIRERQAAIHLIPGEKS